MNAKTLVPLSGVAKVPDPICCATPVATSIT